MTKFYGAVGYAETVETSPGVWTERFTERMYTGDVVRLIKRWENGEGLNDDLTSNNQISILSDPYAVNHFFEIRYVNWMGTNWKVTSVEVQYPRLILFIGGVYNGDTSFRAPEEIGGDTGEQPGVLSTPDEYSNNLSSYYL